MPKTRKIHHIEALGKAISRLKIDSDDEEDNMDRFNKEFRCKLKISGGTLHRFARSRKIKRESHVVRAKAVNQEKLKK